VPRKVCSAVLRNCLGGAHLPLAVWLQAASFILSEAGNTGTLYYRLVFSCPRLSSFTSANTLLILSTFSLSSLLISTFLAVSLPNALVESLSTFFAEVSRLSMDEEVE